MKTSHYLIVLAFFSLTFSCKKKEKTQPEVETNDVEIIEETKPKIKKIKVSLQPKSDSNVKGTVIFNETDGEVLMTALLEGLSEGDHAIHIHEKADCSANDGTSTGGHWNPTKSKHGKWGDDSGYHRGDIGNLKADSKGNASISLKTDEWCIGCEDPTKNIIGKAIIVHEGIDDFVSQPTGAAGGRISCGGIIE